MKTITYLATPTLLERAAPRDDPWRGEWNIFYTILKRLQNIRFLPEFRQRSFKCPKRSQKPKTKLKSKLKRTRNVDRSKNTPFLHRNLRNYWILFYNTEIFKTAVTRRIDTQIRRTYLDLPNSRSVNNTCGNFSRVIMFWMFELTVTLTFDQFWPKSNQR